MFDVWAIIEFVSTFIFAHNSLPRILPYYSLFTRFCRLCKKANTLRRRPPIAGQISWHHIRIPIACLHIFEEFLFSPMHCIQAVIFNEEMVWKKAIYNGNSILCFCEFRSSFTPFRHFCFKPDTNQLSGLSTQKIDHLHKLWRKFSELQRNWR